MIDYIEDWIESIWQLFAKAAATSVMVVWNETLGRIVLTGPRPTDTLVRSHLYWLWAISITLVGSLLAVLCEKWEQQLRAKAVLIEREGAQIVCGQGSVTVAR